MLPGGVKETVERKEEDIQRVLAQKRAGFVVLVLAVDDELVRLVVETTRRRLLAQGQQAGRVDEGDVSDGGRNQVEKNVQERKNGAVDVELAETGDLRKTTTRNVQKTTTFRAIGGREENVVMGEIVRQRHL